MNENSVSDKKTQLRTLGLQTWILSGIAAAVALGVTAYIAYQYIPSSSATFAIKDVDPVKWRTPHPTNEPAATGDEQEAGELKPVRIAPVGAMPDARPADPEMAEIERELERPKTVATVTPYSGAAIVPLALAASPDSSNGSANADPGQAALALLDPATAVPADGSANDALRQWLVDWQRGAAEGRGGVDMLSPGFQHMVEASSLRCPALYALGHSVGFIEGDKVAAVFYRVALSRAEQDFRSTGERSQSSVRATADALYGMSDTFMAKLKDYPTSERIFSLLQQCEKGDPARLRKVTVLYAAAMRLQDPAKVQASAKLLEGLLNEPLSADERREVACVLAQAMFDAGKYQEVPAVLKDWQQHGLQAAHVEQGWVLLVRAAIRCGQMEDARQTYAQWKQKAGPDHTLPLDQEEVNALASPR